MTETKHQFAIADLLTAIETTSSEMGSMGERITDLEAANYRMEEENTQLRVELSDVIKRVEAAQATSQAATEGADSAEASAAAYRNRVDELQTELKAANDDLVKISNAVSGVLTRHAAGR